VECLHGIVIFVTWRRRDIQQREIDRPAGKQRPPRKIGAPIGRAAVFHQIRHAGGRHDRRIGLILRGKQNHAFTADEESERTLVRQGRPARDRGHIGNVDLSHERQRLALVVSRPRRGANARRTAEPTARARPVSTDLTWATRNQKCRKLCAGHQPKVKVRIAIAKAIYA
jgi:hypothetical protein